MPRSRRRRRKKIPDANSSTPWMLTYSDMVTLLLTFFVLLFAMSAIDVERFRMTVLSIQSSLIGHTGIFESLEPEAPDDISGGPDIGTLDDLGQAMLEKLREAELLQSQAESFLDRVGLEGAVEARIEERGVVMELPNQIFFERGSAELKPQAKEFLKDLAQFFKEIKHQVIIEGHTCTLPSKSVRFPSNWELSVARSVGVTRYLVETQGLEPGRFIATGYGEHQPITDNDTPEGRARNRRVTVVLSLQNN